MSLEFQGLLLLILRELSMHTDQEAQRLVLPNVFRQIWGFCSLEEFSRRSLMVAALVVRIATALSLFC